MKQLKLSVRDAMRVACIVLATSVGCQPKVDPTPAKVAALVKRTKQQLIYVKGGEFLMGDFGEIHSPEQLPYTGPFDDGPLHKVLLSDFLILPYKVTIEDYDVYAAAAGVPKAYHGTNSLQTDKRLLTHPQSGTFPIGVDWSDARHYCQWLGRQIGHVMDLPTEAQWEYAARARGEMLIFATNNGQEEPGINFPTHEQTDVIGGRSIYEMPVGMYPANRLGLFDLANNGYEWMRDWYSADYYEKSPLKDPPGPASGSQKVLRSKPNGHTHPALTFERTSREPALSESRGVISNRTYGFRCASSPSSAGI